MAYKDLAQQRVYQRRWIAAKRQRTCPECLQTFTAWSTHMQTLHTACTEAQQTLHQLTPELQQRVVGPRGVRLEVTECLHTLHAQLAEVTRTLERVERVIARLVVLLPGRETLEDSGERLSPRESHS